MDEEAAVCSNTNTMYVTQGTVQVELKTQPKTDIEIRINPVQDFAAKYGEEVYIVFLPVSATPQLDAKAVNKKTQTFSASLRLARVLTCAAFKSSRVELIVDFAKTPPEIVSIKIPATFGSDTV